MPRSMITIRPKGGEVVRLTGDLSPSDTEAGWSAAFLADVGMVDMPADRVVGEAADVAVDEVHYSAQVVEYHHAEGRMVIEGGGPPPGV
jgi:hypothetical protein